MSKRGKLLLYIVALTVVCGCANKTSNGTDKNISLKGDIDTEITEETEEVEETAEIEETAEAEESLEEATKVFEELLGANMTADDGEILDILINDYDLDGVFEAFAFTGSFDKDAEFGAYEGKIWYVNHKEAVRLTEENMYVENPGMLYSFSERNYYVVNESYATGQLTYIYSIRDDNAYEEGVSRLGYLGMLEGDDCTISHSTYDASYDPSIECTLGHTWKLYYFHYSPEEDCIVEYVGKEITEQEAEELCPKGLLDEIKAAGNTLGNIYLRDNGIININYYNTDSSGCINYGNANYDTVMEEFISAWGDGNGGWEDSNYGGIYLEAYAE